MFKSRKFRQRKFSKAGIPAIAGKVSPMYYHVLQAHASRRLVDHRMSTDMSYWQNVQIFFKGWRQLVHSACHKYK